MREIKFRAWDGENMAYSDQLGSLERFFGLYEDLGYDNPKPIMRYTGLKDKNGVEIYENDIIEHDGNIDTVGWDKDGAAFGFIYDDGCSCWAWGWPESQETPLEQFTVIGNTFQSKFVVEISAEDNKL